jgi:beta-glucosidase
MLDASSALTSPIAVAASWDAGTARLYGVVSGRHTRGSGANVAAVALNAFGDDPLLRARIGAAFVRGVQSDDAIAAVFPGVDAGDMRAVRELEWPALQAAVTDGAAGAVTCELRDGAHASLCADRHAFAAMLTRDVAFDGLVVGVSGDLASATRAAMARKHAASARRTTRLPDAATLARRFAQNGAVLLKNGGVLPLDPASTSSIAIAGGDDAMAAALRAVLPNARVAQIGEIDPGAVAAAAKRAATCVLVFGPQAADNEEAIVRSAARANSRTVVVLERSIAAPPAWADAAAAIVLMWNPSPGTPAATADVLAGASDPGGRMPLAFDLGDGLSYATFAYSDMRVTYGHGAKAAPVTVSFMVRNTAARPGSDVPQLYLTLPAAAGEATSRLAAFSRVTLAAGAARRVTFPLDASSFAYWSPSYKAWFVAPGSYRASAGPSRAAAALSAQVRIVAR